MQNTRLTKRVESKLDPKALISMRGYLDKKSPAIFVGWQVSFTIKDLDTILRS